MSYRIKVDPKDTLADEAHLRSGVEHAAAVLRQHQRQISIGFLIVLIVVMAIGVVVWLDRQNAEQAMALEQQGTRLYLDRPADQPTKADENLKKAIAFYHQSFDQYPRGPTAPLTLYHLANALVQINDLDGAINAYQKFLSMYSEHKALLSLVYQRLGYAYLLRGNAEQASKAFSVVLEMTEALNKDQVLFELGKIEESQSHPEGALARYQELIKTYPNSPFTGEATVRTKALEVKKGPLEGMTGIQDGVPVNSGNATKGKTEGKP